MKWVESEYDFFGVVYVFILILFGFGMVVVWDFVGDDNNVIVVIGDGFMSVGMVYEVMNNVGVMYSWLIVILNDNDMFIVLFVGVMSVYFV